MKKLLLLLLIYGASLFALGAYAQCGTAVQNLIEDFNTLPDPNDRSVLPDCWSSVGGQSQMDSGGILLVLLGSSNPGTLITPDVENGAGVITFKARKTSSFTVFLSVGYYAGGTFREAVKYTLGGNFQTYTYDYATYHSTISTQTNLAFKITSGANSGVQRLLIDDLEYKSFCQPAANPTALAKDITVKLDETGNAIVNPANVDNGSTDDCGEFITNFSLDKTLFTCDDLGLNPVTLTATDSEGQTATATATITVEPDFVFNSNQLALDENGESIIDIDFLTRSKTDCDDVTYALDITRLTCEDAGNHLLTVTATYNGMSTTFSATKNLRDFLNPVAVAQDISVSIDETTGVAIVTPEMIDDGSSDNCGITSMTLSKTSFDCGDQGENEVTLTVTDAANRTATATAIVTVGSFLEDFGVTSSTTTVCFDGSNESSGVTIETSGSTVGTQYYLRNDADSSVVDGPIDGTGSGLSFDAGTISENTTFHVYGEVPFSGKALDLNASGAHLSINTPASFDYSTGYTISAWVKLGASGNSTFYNGIFYAGGVTGSDIEIYENSSGNITVLHNRGNGGTQANYVIPGNAITNSTYVHFAATYNGLASRIFVNGVDVGAASIAAPIKSGSSEMTFGHMNSSTFPAAQRFSGLMDDIRVYDKALSASEILADYDKCISGTENDLVFYYDLESINGSIYTDLVNGTPAQIKNGAVSTDEGAISCSFTCNRIMTERTTIGDDLAPTVTTSDISIELSSVGFASITADMINNGSSDNCSANESLVYSLDRVNFGCEDIGENAVTLTITDEAGNSASSTAIVTVNSIIEDETVTPLVTNLCPGEDNGTTISLGSSVQDVNYYLRNSADNSVIEGPIMGTGAALDFTTGDLTEETTFHVLASRGSSENPHALEFEKGNQYVAAGEDVDFSYDQGYTVEAWINAPFSTNFSHAILEYGTSSSSDLQIYVQGNTGRLTIVHDRSGSAKTFFQYPRPPINQWAHIAITYDGGTSGIKVYYDGLEQTIVNSVNPTGLLPKRAGATLNIGRALTFNSSSDNFQGLMDEVRIWDTPRSLSELTGTMNNCLSGTESGLVSYFQFNEGNGTLTKDLAGSNDGTLTNMDEATDWVTNSPIVCQGCELIMSTEVVITVGDVEVPNVITQDISIVLDANGDAVITPEDINNGSTDNCTASEALVYSLDQTTFDINDLGENMVTLTVTDASQNTGTGVAIVTVLDREIQEVTFTGVADKTFDDADFSIEASLNSGLPVTFTVTSGGLTITESGVGNTGGGSATFMITGAGTATIEVTNDGDATYAPLQESIVIEIAKADQILTVDEISNKSVVVQPFNVVASVNTNLTLDYAISGPATISQNVVTLDGTPGTVEVTVSQAGTDDYNSVSSTISFEVVAQQSQSITFTDIPDLTYGATDQTLSASASSGLAVNFALISGPGALTGNTLAVTGSGTIVIEANQAGDDDYLVAVAIQQTIMVTKAPLTVTADDQTITFGDAIPVLTINYNGFVNGEGNSVLSSAPVASTTATESSNAGSYDITIAGGAADNYELTLINGTLTIDKAIAGITITDLEQTVDETPSPKSPTVVTDPTGLNYIITYDGSLDSPSAVGSYQVVVNIDEQNYTGSKEVTFNINAILSIDDEVGVSTNVYPNPVADVLTIESEQSLIGKVILFNIKGDRVIDHNLKPSQNRINVSTLPQGLYILIIQDENTAIIKKQKLLINK